MEVFGTLETFRERLPVLIMFVEIWNQLGELGYNSFTFLELLDFVVS